MMRLLFSLLLFLLLIGERLANSTAGIDRCPGAAPAGDSGIHQATASAALSLAAP